MKPKLFSLAGRFEAATWYGPFKDHPKSCGRALLELGIGGSLVLESDAGPGGTHLQALGLKVAPILDPHPGLFFVRPHLAERLPRFLADRLNPAHRVRVPCWNNPEERRRFLDAIVARALAYEAEVLLWLTVANEGASTKQNAAFDFCFCTFCQKAFRRWLAQRYGSLAGLNRVWHSDHGGWDSVRLVATDELKNDVDGVFNAWHDTRQFVDEGYHDALAEACTALRLARPGVPLSLNGLWPSGPFGSQNWDRICDIVDLVETNDECGDLEVARSFAEGKSDLAFTFPIVKAHEALFWDHTFWMFFIHGARAVVIEKFRRLFNLETDKAFTPGAENLAAKLDAVQKTLAPALAGFEREDDPVLVLHSPRSQARAWADKVVADGQEWVCRSPAWMHNEEPYLAAQASWYRLIEDAGRQFKVVSERTGLDALPGRGRLLTVPLPAALSVGEQAWIRRFAATGGTVACCGHVEGVEGKVLKLPPETERYRKTRLLSMARLPELVAFKDTADAVLPVAWVRFESERNERVEATLFKQGEERILALQRNDIRRFFTSDAKPGIPQSVRLTLCFKEPLHVESLWGGGPVSEKACIRISVILEPAMPIFLRLTRAALQ